MGTFSPVAPYSQLSPASPRLCHLWTPDSSWHHRNNVFYTKVYPSGSVGVPGPGFCHSSNCHSMAQHLGRECFPCLQGGPRLAFPWWPHGELHLENPPLPPQPHLQARSSPCGYGGALRSGPPASPPFFGLAERPEFGPEGWFGLPPNGRHLQHLSLWRMHALWVGCAQIPFQFYRIIDYFLCLKKYWVHPISAGREGRSFPDWNVGRNKENPCFFSPASIVLLACKAHTEFAVHSFLPCSSGEALLWV